MTLSFTRRLTSLTTAYLSRIEGNVPSSASRAEEDSLNLKTRMRTVAEEKHFGTKRTQQKGKTGITAELSNYVKRGKKIDCKANTTNLERKRNTNYLSSSYSRSIIHALTLQVQRASKFTPCVQVEDVAIREQRRSSITRKSERIERF